MNNELGLRGPLLQGPGGSGFIVLPSEYGSSDQTDIDSTVILDPLGRWSVIPKESPDWTPEGGGRPGL